MIFYVHCSYLFIKKPLSVLFVFHLIRHIFRPFIRFSFEIALGFVEPNALHFCLSVDVFEKTNVFQVSSVHHHNRNTRKNGSIHSVILLLRLSVFCVRSTAITSLWKFFSLLVFSILLFFREWNFPLVNISRQPTRINVLARPFIRFSSHFYFLSTMF